MRTERQLKTMENLTSQIVKQRRKAWQKSFQDLASTPHRLQQIRQKNGTIYINDSKAENVNATYFALNTIKKPVVWLAGGADQKTDYWELMAPVRQKVKAIIMIGENNERLLAFFAPVMQEIYEVQTMEEAVLLANRISTPQTTVLLSPGCKPDNRYVDYMERGNQFVSAVKKL